MLFQAFQASAKIVLLSTLWMSAQANAEILSDNSSRTISTSTQGVGYTPSVQSGSATTVSKNVRIVPTSQSTASADINDEVVSYVFSGQRESSVSGDSMQGLIQQKQRELASVQKAQLTINENKRILSKGSAPVYSTGINISSLDFKSWLNSDPYNATQAANYQKYLAARVGAQNVPPLQQLLTTARSWEDCGYEPYQLPPQYLWQNMVPTLKLYAELKRQGILPPSTEIRSVYRSPDLNQCAGGAGGSKHMSNGAMDIWVPNYDGDLWRTQQMQDRLCEFWLYQGQSYDFGLGIYGTGAIHIDTQGYRKWGGNHSSSSSPCRY